METVLFHRERKSSLSEAKKALKDLTRIHQPPQILAEERRQVLLEKIRTLLQLESAQYDALAASLIDTQVLYCQNLPETAHSYFSQPGGLLDHALNRTEAALEIFKEFMIHDRAEVISEEQKLWQYALFSAAMLQGIGKLYIDYHARIYDAQGQFLKDWNPLLEHMAQMGSYYGYEFQKDMEISLRRRINLLLAKTMMPPGGYNWIAAHGDVLAVWLALLNEDERSAGTLGAILIRADALAIQRYFLEFAPRGFAHGTGGRYGGVGTFSGGADSLIEKERQVGMEFIQWLHQALEHGQVIINKAPLLMVPGGLLMCKEIFQLFVREHPEYKNWQAIQTAFASLGLHQTAADGSMNIHFEHALAGKQTGINFTHYAMVLPKTVTVKTAAGAVENLSSMELMLRAQDDPTLATSTNTVQTQLNGAGQWVTSKHEQPTMNAGVKKGG